MTPEERIELLKSTYDESLFVFPQNPFWKLSESQKPKIHHRDTNEPLDIEHCFGSDFNEIQKVFSVVWESVRSECQIICITLADWKKIQSANTHLAKTISIVHESSVKLGDVLTPIVYIMPMQTNTYGNTIIHEKIWYNLFTKNDITPVFRIHSHHILHAYQSQTDYDYLNSGTLEVVMGKVLDETYELAYWLDEPGTDNKSIVFANRKDV